MKDAKGHGSDSHGSNMTSAQRTNTRQDKIWDTAKRLNPEKFGSAAGEQHTQALADQHGISTQHLNSSGHAWGSPAALADFKREHGGPANKGQLARIARFHKAVGRG